MVTKDIVRVEFDKDKIGLGDIVSYKVRVPTLFGNKRELRYGIVSKVSRKWVHITGNDYDEFSDDIGIHSSNATDTEIAVIIEGLRK